MKKLDIALGTAIAVGLVAGSSMAVAAQDATAEGVTFVSGVMVENEQTDPGAFVPGESVSNITDSRFDQQVEWSDPRLPSRRVVVSNADLHQPIETGAIPFNSTVLLEGANGTWTGTAVGYFEGNFGDFVGTNVLVGHGAYDGLSAVLYETAGEAGRHAWEGIIFEGGMPSMPEAISAQ
jgi:hypothetical protein